MSRNLLRRSAVWAFYRLAYLRRGPLAGLAQRLYKGPQQICADRWNEEYGSGYWDKLTDVREQARYGVLLAYGQYYCPDASVLDVGCGDGRFFLYLRQCSYRRYLGIDLSEVAVGKASRWADEKSRFVAADANTFEPAEDFDVIVFNECLNYFDDPIAVIGRYARRLTEGGVVLVSMFQHPHTAAICRRIRQCTPVLDETSVTNSAGTWQCMALARPQN